MTRSRWAAFIIGALFIVASMFAGVTSAHAEPPANCDWQYDTTYRAYFYPQGNYWVSAAEWHDYGNEASNGCDDIWVQIANTGSMVIRTVVCPVGGSCYVIQPNDGWGSLSTFPGPTFGITLHSYSMPCGGACAFLFRLETRSFSDPGTGVAENIKLTF